MDDIREWCLQACNNIVMELGIGHSEVVYHKAFIVELIQTQFLWESEKVIPIVYKNLQIGFVKSDIVINNNIVLEFKSLTRKLSENDIRQTNKYMELARIKKGMLINFSRYVDNNVEFVLLDNHKF